MKYIGIVLVAASLTLSGLYAVRLMKKRVGTLDAAVLFMTLTENSLEFTRMPVPALIRDISGHSGVEQLDFLSECSELCLHGEDFPLAWRKSVHDSRSMLKRQEREKLMEFGELMGQSDLNGQLKICALYKSFFLLMRQSARRTLTRYGSLLAAAGLLCGMLTAIILL